VPGIRLAEALPALRRRSLVQLLVEQRQRTRGHTVNDGKSNDASIYPSEARMPEDKAPTTQGAITPERCAAADAASRPNTDAALDAMSRYSEAVVDAPKVARAKVGM
jgi:hypothetical protein